jgi:hypothetical protein
MAELATIFPGPESAGLFYLERFTEGPGNIPHQFSSPTLVLHQAVEPDVTRDFFGMNIQFA